MTHFIGAVVVPARIAKDYTTGPTPYPTLYGEGAHEVKSGPDLHAHLDEILAPFNEELEVERWESKEFLIAKERERTLAHTGPGSNHEEYKKDPAAYRAAHPYSHEQHFEYMETGLDKDLARTDDEVYADIIKYEEPENIRESDGAIRNTYNPNSKWDWWTIGGRWEDTYRNRQGESLVSFLTGLRETKAKLDAGENCNPHKGEPLAAGGDLPWYFPHNLLTPNGDWLQIGRTGWFGMRSDDMTEAQWIDQMIEALSPLTEDAGQYAVIYIDFHI